MGRLFASSPFRLKFDLFFFSSGTSVFLDEFDAAGAFYNILLVTYPHCQGDSVVPTYRWGGGNILSSEPQV